MAVNLSLTSSPPGCLIMDLLCSIHCHTHSLTQTRTMLTQRLGFGMFCLEFIHHLLFLKDEGGRGVLTHGEVNLVIYVRVEGDQVMHLKIHGLPLCVPPTRWPKVHLMCISSLSWFSVFTSGWGFLGYEHYRVKYYCHWPGQFCHSDGKKYYSHCFGHGVVVLGCLIFAGKGGGLFQFHNISLAVCLFVYGPLHPAQVHPWPGPLVIKGLIGCIILPFQSTFQSILQLESEILHIAFLNTIPYFVAVVFIWINPSCSQMGN